MQIRANTNGNQIIHTNADARARAEERAGRKSRQVNGKQSIFAGDLGLHGDMISLRRQRAQKKALKIIGDAWNGEKKVDQSITDIRDRMLGLWAEKEENLGYIAQGDAQKEALRVHYGVSSDSQEQKDLELLEKKEKASISPAGEVHFTQEELDRLEVLEGRKPTAEDFELLKKKADSEMPGSTVKLTEEEEAKLAELEGVPLTEYQERCLKIDKYQQRFEVRNIQIDEEIMNCNRTIGAIQLERLKHQEMVKAQKKADEVMEAANDEIFGMLVDEAKDHVDEDLEETREEAKEEAEEKAEQEEKIEERKEQQEQLEEQVEETQVKNEEQERLRREASERSREDADLLESMIDVGMGNTGSVSDVQTDVKTMLHKMKLLEEDLKGSMVDDQA